MKNLKCEDEFAKAVAEKLKLHLEWMKTLRGNDINAELDTHEEYQNAKVKVAIIKANLNKTLGW